MGVLNDKRCKEEGFVRYKSITVLPKKENHFELP